MNDDVSKTSKRESIVALEALLDAVRFHSVGDDMLNAVSMAIDTVHQSHGPAVAVCNCDIGNGNHVAANGCPVHGPQIAAEQRMAIESQATIPGGEGIEQRDEQRTVAPSGPQSVAPPAVSEAPGEPLEWFEEDGEKFYYAYGVNRLADRERTLLAEVERLERECETERLRLAACGVAANGTSTAGCHPNYLSDSLNQVIRLNARCDEARAQVERYRKALELIAAPGPRDKIEHFTGIAQGVLRATGEPSGEHGV